ncbi:MAG: zinc-binding dehydrogenase, partial [Deltaproteobacteria bacterium]|nr:zinc-binding dehydrogenase [Deltaproteobacteria bacterium]
DIVRIFWNQLTVMGSTMGTHAEFSEMLRMVSGGRIVPVVDSVLSLSEVKAAQQRLEEKRQFGKIVLRVD